jgi:cytochrome c oxidase cbb3-type subunit 3
MKPVAAIGLAALALMLALAGCEREKRRFEKPLQPLDPRVAADADVPLQPGESGRGMRATAAAGGYDPDNSYEVAQGKQWFRWYNCSGCHSPGGGGAIGPALSDENWIYGSDPDTIFATIMEGRPNGMPAFRGRIPQAQAWQLVAYVRSLSGLAPGQSETNRADTLYGAEPEYRRKPTPPERKPKK